VRPRTPKENRVEVLPPILAGLRRAHPELVLSNRVDDLLHRSADIAVRMLRPVQAALADGMAAYVAGARRKART